MAAPAQVPAPAGHSKKARIWRRTLVGGGLAIALAGLLWTVHATQSQAFVLGIGAVIAGLCVFEGARMGALRREHLAAPLWVAWFAAAALATGELATAHAAGVSAAGRERYLGHTFLLCLWLSALVAVGLAALDHRSRSRADRIAGCVLMASAGVFALAVVRVATGRGDVRRIDDLWHFLAMVSSKGFGRGWPVLLSGAFLAGIAALAFVCRRAEMLRLARLAGWSAPWLVLPFSWLAYVGADWQVAGLIALVILSKIGDTAGYYAGSAFGRHHPFPRISPGKTSEGCLASLVAGTAAGVALVHFGLLPRAPFGLWGGAAVGAATNLAAQAGDLLESYVKRKAGVKDSGSWFGPSGGVLDLVDSFQLSIPAALLVWPLLLELPGASGR